MGRTPERHCNIDIFLILIPILNFFSRQISEMLQSKTTGDVVEALRFFTRAINFKIAGALNLFKRCVMSVSLLFLT
jgi:hypothetical protein